MVEFTVFKGSKEGKVIKSSSSREIRPDEVLIKITHSGLCGTDEHYKRKDMVLGHEGAGTIAEVGRDIKSFVKGDSVGWGYQHGCCGTCKQCLRGHETLCPERKMFGASDLDQGSFGSYAVWKASFVFHIPEVIERKYAAPFMCGGATVWNALQLGCKPSDRVGVIGVGGLGHLAIQFAAKMGCSVVVFSGTGSKKAEALKLGATEFIATRGLKELPVGEPIDHLLVTTSAQPDWAQLLPVMAPGGTIYPLSVSAEELKMPYAPLLSKELTIQGSLVASRKVLIEMLTFAARHGIRPIIEEFPMTEEGIKECMEKLESGEMRYRGVLIAQ